MYVLPPWPRGAMQCVQNGISGSCMDTLFKFVARTRRVKDLDKSFTHFNRERLTTAPRLAGIVWPLYKYETWVLKRVQHHRRVLVQAAQSVSTLPWQPWPSHALQAETSPSWRPVISACQWRPKVSSLTHAGQPTKLWEKKLDTLNKKWHAQCGIEG